MTTDWGVYNLTAKLPDGTHVEANDRRATRWFIRWRVNGSAHKRTFKAKGHAKTFHARLLAAQGMDWPADERGYPIEPSRLAAKAADPEPRPPSGPTFENYCEHTWYPTARTNWADKNRLGHRRNMRLAIEYLRYKPQDPRLSRGDDRQAGGSIKLADLVPDDVLRALALRKTSNGRTAAVNARRIQRARTTDQQDLDLAPEATSPATVRAFYITLAMILRAAHASGHTSKDPLLGTAKHAPKPTQKRISQRVVPTIDEVFDLADAIATLGPPGPDGRPQGERFRALALAAGTLGPRPGELVAHRSDWIDWADDHTVVRFHQTEAAVYDTEEGIRGRRTRQLKHRDEDEWREVPALAAVADTLRLHLERGYGTDGRTFTSVTGKPLDWHNIIQPYWRPACERVFTGSTKPQLATMTPSLLRKAAITFWLDSGINPLLAADWAGHSEDVSRRYYAGRAASTWQREAELLGAHHLTA